MFDSTYVYSIELVDRQPILVDSGTLDDVESFDIQHSDYMGYVQHTDLCKLDLCMPLMIDIRYRWYIVAVVLHGLGSNRQMDLLLK